MLYSSKCVLNIVFPIGLNLNILNMTGIWKNFSYVSQSDTQGRYSVNPKNVLQQIDLSNNRLAQFLDDPTLAHVELSGLDRLEEINIRNNNLLLNYNQNYLVVSPPCALFF